jgi:hypothetical protein
MLAVGRRAVTCGSVQIARRVIARFGLSVTQPGRDVTILRSQARLPATHTCQLVGPGVFAVLGGLGAIFRRHLAVIDSLGAVVRSFSVPRWGPGPFRLLTLTHRAVPCGSVEVTRCVIARRGFSVALLGLTVTNVRGQIAVAPFYVPLTCRRQGVLAFV